MMPRHPIDYFKEITAIPRDSGDESRIAEYLTGFAKSRGLYAERDGVDNVLIRKPGSPGLESAPALVLQGHTDMVYVKTPDSAHDYDSPLELYESDGLLRAKGTSLGADDGIAIAYMLALLDDDAITHPPIEAVFTSGEEVGMTGVAGFNAGSLTGRRMINLDSEEEGVFIAGCAGGMTPVLTLKPEWISDIPAGYKSFEITVTGLLGGHSGKDIDKSRGNAIRLLGRLLLAVSCHLGALVGEMEGGAKSNAIPSYARAVALVRDAAALHALMSEYGAIFKSELSASDPNVEVVCGECGYGGGVLSARTLESALTLLLTIPDGVLSMHDKPALPESSNNIGILRLDGGALTITCLVRSSKRSLKLSVCEQIRLIAEAAGAEISQEADCPEWEYEPKSPLRDKAAAVYKRLFGTKPKVTVMHAGLECGYFKELYPDMDIISAGPSIYDIHTPEEALNLASADRMWEWLKEIAGC